MTDTLPALLGPPPETTRDRLDRIARCQAVAALVAEEEATVRADLEAEADTIEAATGGAYNVPVKGLARAYRTDPQPKPYVADRDALAAWFHEEEPSLVRVEERVEVRDHTAAAQALRELEARTDDVNRIHDDQVEQSHAFRLTEVAGALLASLSVRGEVTIPADPVQALLDLGGDGPPRYVLTGDGLVHAPTGVLVPGVEVRTARRTLTVRVEPDARKRYVAELRALLGAGALEEASTDA